MCSRNFLVPKFFLDNELSRFCCFFLSHIAEKHRGRTLLCFRFVLVSNFLDSRGITNLLIVCVSECRKICREPFNDSKQLGRPKTLCIIGEFHDFPLIYFKLTRPKIIRRGTLRCFKESRVSESFMHEGGRANYDSPPYK